MMTPLVFTVAVLLPFIFTCQGAPTPPTKPTDGRSTVSKRSLNEFGGFEGDYGSGGWPNEWQPWNNFPSGQWAPTRAVPTQMEVAGAIAAAKQASENVLIAQQQMMAAKENVLNVQKMAADREANAQIAQQKLESAAAIQRSEAASAAQNVILAQKRLAASKAALAHQQKLASVKESHAAEFLRSAAHAAALEIQRTENQAARLSEHHRNGAAASLHHVIATKDTIVSPILHGSNRNPSGTLPIFPVGPWSAAPPGGHTGAHFNPLGLPNHPPGLFNPKHWI